MKKQKEMELMISSLLDGWKADIHIKLPDGSIVKGSGEKFESGGTCKNGLCPVVDLNKAKAMELV